MSSELSIALDIETLDVADSAIIIEIGLVAFLRTDFTIIDRRAIPLDLFDQILNYRTLTQETIDYHRRNRSLPTQFSGHLPEAAFTLLHNFVQLHNPAKIWIQGPDFDLPKLRSYFQPTGKELPWKYHNVRDARTIWDAAFPGTKHDPRPHNAVPDCIATIHDLAKALIKLGATAAA